MTSVMIRTGHTIEQRGFVFTLIDVGITVTNESGLHAIIPTLTANGLNFVRTVEAMEMEIDFWLGEFA